MEVKIKQGEEMIDATIEMVDGVMVVSPKKAELDVSQFRTGDILVCGWKTSEKACEWICILDGQVEKQSDTTYFLEDFCSMFTDGTNIWIESSCSDSATYVRYATEEEKKLLFDKLAEKGYEWNSAKKELVRIRWKPAIEEDYYTPSYKDIVGFEPCLYAWDRDETDLNLYSIGWCFKTEEECQAFCEKLNQAISQVKP